MCCINYNATTLREKEKKNLNAQNLSTHSVNQSLDVQQHTANTKHRHSKKGYICFTDGEEFGAGASSEGCVKELGMCTTVGSVGQV